MAYVWQEIEGRLDAMAADVASAAASVSAERDAMAATALDVVHGVEASFMPEVRAMRAEVARLRADAEARAVADAERVSRATATITALCDALQTARRDAVEARGIVAEQCRAARRIAAIHSMAPQGELSAILADVRDMLSGEPEAMDIAAGDLESRARTAGNPNVTWDDEGKAHFGSQPRAFLHDEQMRMRYDSMRDAYPDGFARRG